MDEQCTFSPGIVDHIVGASSTNPIIIDHDVEPSGQEQMQCLFEENIKDNNVIHQAAQSRRLKFVEARSYDQSDQIGFDGDQMLTRLSQADSPKGQQVHTNDDGVKSSSKDIVKKCINNNLEDENSMKSTMETSSTGGQPENSKTDANTTKESKGHGKHKGRKPKVTFAQLLEKYQKISEAKSAYRPSETKASKSPPRHKFEDRDWRRKKLSKQTPYPPFGPPMPMSWIPPHVVYYSDQSWNKYKSRAHRPSYSKPPHQNYAAPRGSSFVQQPHVKDRLNQKESVWGSAKKMDVVKQVYRVKKDGRKCAVSDPTPDDKKPAGSTLATNGKEVKRVTFKDPIIESGQAKPEVPKVRKEFLVHKTKSQPGCSLGLSHWQERKLKRLRVKELEKRNMAWVPKRNPQVKSGITSPVAKLVGVKEDKCEAGRWSRQFSSHYRGLQMAHRPCSSTVPSKPASQSLTPAETSELFRLFTLWWTGSPYPSR